MVKIIVAVLCLLLPLTCAKFVNVNYCDKKANYPVKVSGIDISPYPISRSVNTTFAIAASTDTPISGGTLKIDVEYIWFYVYSESHDLCKKTACPVSSGDFVIAHSQELPGITPPGSYTLKMSLMDEQKRELTCITFDFSIWFMESEGLAQS